MNDLSVLKQQLRELLPLGLDVLLKRLKEQLPENSPAYRDLLLLEGRYRDLNRQLIRATISTEAANIAFNRLREEVLNYIDHLQAADLVANATTDIEGPKQGKLSYHIPTQMVTQREERCRVRIAFTEQQLRENWPSNVSMRIIKPIRIGEVMSADLIDPSGEPAFTIRSFSEEVQFVDPYGYTEWLFFVMPLREGKHSLFLRVCLVEMRYGKEYRREITFEEQIAISSTPSEVAPVERQSTLNLQFGLSQKRAVAPTPPQLDRFDPPVAPAPAPAKRRRSWQPLMAAATILLFVGFFFWPTFRNNPGQENGVPATEPLEQQGDPSMDTPSDSTLNQAPSQPQPSQDSTSQ